MGVIIRQANKKIGTPQIVKKQYFLSAFLIAKFTNNNTGKVVKLGKKSQIFTANTAWNQWAEKNYMLKIENGFEKVLRNVVMGE